jgi:hypothetical protein
MTEDNFLWINFMLMTLNMLKNSIQEVSKYVNVIADLEYRIYNEENCLCSRSRHKSLEIKPLEW